MMWVFLGMLVGGSWLMLARPFPVLATPVDALTAAMSEAGAGGASAVLRAFGLGVDTPLAHAAGAIAAAVVPGLICLLVAEAVTTSRSARNAVATLLTICAFLSFLWLSGPQALGLLIAVVILNALLAVGHGLLLQLPVAAAITAIVGRLIFDIFRGAHHLNSSVATMVEIGGDPGMWRPVLAIAAIIPAIGAIGLLLRSK
jgi:hypothetical protein